MSAPRGDVDEAVRLAREPGDLRVTVPVSELDAGKGLGYLGGPSAETRRRAASERRTSSTTR